MPFPWTSDLLPEALVGAIVAAIAGGLIGALLGCALRGQLPRRAVARTVPAVALLAIAGVLADGLWTTTPENVRAQVTLRDLGPGPERQVGAEVRIDPPQAAEDPAWLNVTAWQGGGLLVDRLAAQGDGTYRTTGPIPVHGDWKASIRLQRGREVLGLPVYMPRDTAIPAPGVPARRSFTRPFVDDHQLLQREQKQGVPDWLTTVAPLGVLALALGFLATLAWGLSRVARRSPEQAARCEAPASATAHLHPHRRSLVTAKDAFPLQEVTLHGHRVGFRIAGEGPLIVLIHGITSTSDVWLATMARLAERYTVVAPDLLGHGRSAKPRGDYSLGAYASGARDLLGVLGFERGTVVGHSLGGGIALQFAYQFPEYTRAAGARLQRRARQGGSPAAARGGAAGRRARAAAHRPRLGGRRRCRGRRVSRPLRRAAGPDLAEAARGYASLADRGAREAFLHTLRAVIDLEGQRVSATDRLYLAEGLPTLLIWGSDDPIIPIEHARAGRQARIPDSRLVEIAGAGHWPQLDDPDRFVAELSEFVETTEPHVFDLDRMRQMLRRGPGLDAATA